MGLRKYLLPASGSNDTDVETLNEGPHFLAK